MNNYNFLLRFFEKNSLDLIENIMCFRKQLSIMSLFFEVKKKLKYIITFA